MNRLNPRPVLCLFGTLLLGAVPAGLAAAPVAVPEVSETVQRYHDSGTLLWLVGQLLHFSVPALILFTGLSARLRGAAQNFLERAGWPSGRQGFRTALVVLYFLMYSLIALLPELPFAFYKGYLRAHEYGLSNQSLAVFWRKYALGAVLNFGIAAALIAGGFALLRFSPRRWWLWCGVACTPVILVLMILGPLYIAPLFNDFGRMQDRQLETRILELASTSGVPAERVFEVNKSADTNKVNAYVTGFGTASRIVLWDTLTQKFRPEETLFVMAHEIGHYVLGHVYQGLAIACIGALLLFYIAARLLRLLLERPGGGTRFGVQSISDPAVLPLLFLIFSGLLLAVRPAGLALSRANERAADRFALELTRDREACGNAFVRLQAENLAHPRPADWIVWLRRGHPTLAERITFCNQYELPPLSPAL